MSGLRRFSKPVAHSLIGIGLLFLAWIFLVVAPTGGTFGFDSFAYWNVTLPDPYSIPWFELGSFTYAPPVALVFDGFSVIEWWVFAFLWLMLLVGSVIWIGWSPVWILAALAFPPVAIELHSGNIHILLAVAIAIGFRHPWLWSFVLLTKPSCGVGLLWFVVRREWRELGIALGSTAVLALVALLVMPSLWADWLMTVLDNVGQPVPINAVPIPLWLRLAVAAIIVIWGAKSDRHWTVVVAATLALPSLWIAGFAMLIGVIPEIRDKRRHASLAASPN